MDILKLKPSYLFLLRLLLMAGVLAVASGIGYLYFSFNYPETNVVVVYLLAVLITTWMTRSFIIGLIASVLATFSYNYFFAVPQFTFSVSDPSYITTFITMTITALLTSTLTSHAQRNAKQARQKEAETSAMYDLTNHLTDAKDVPDIASISVRTISRYFSCQAACLCFDENAMPEKAFIQQLSELEQTRRKVENGPDIMHSMVDLRTPYAVGDEFYDWPIFGSENILGVIRIPTTSAKNMEETQKRLLRAMIENTALAMDRFRSAEQRIRSREETAQERYRATLLRAISHDLRTPLAGIIGASEMLLDMTDDCDPRKEVARGIHRDADWLHALVENILNLTRLQDGHLMLQKQAEPVEEVVASAIGLYSKRTGREITADIPDDLLLVPMDAKLIQQVLLNLLDNAGKHTPIKKEIGITVTPAAETVSFSVWDEGSGIRVDDLPHIFELFYTAKAQHADARSGIGLGLAICETIVHAHGGTISARNREGDMGAAINFTLPLKEAENEPEQ